MLALNTGERDAEIRGLQWERVDFAKAILTVGDSKTAAGEGRTIPINSALLDAMVEYAKWYTKRFGTIQPRWYVFPFGRPRPQPPHTHHRPSRERGRGRGSDVTDRSRHCQGVQMRADGGRWRHFDRAINNRSSSARPSLARVPQETGEVRHT
jgi:integrase